MPTLLERLIPGRAVEDPRIAELSERARVAEANEELFRESITQLQLAMEDVGWVRVLAQAEQEFTRDGLRQITAACRLYGLSNPLIKRGLTLRQVYVWGQGVEVTARANGRRAQTGEQDVNAVLRQFLDDPDNRRTFTGSDAQQRMERSLGTDGNVFVSLWTKPLSGRVQVRLLPWDEIHDVITNPEDNSEPWFYFRRWTETTIDPVSGHPIPTQREAYYPAIGYRPRSRPKTIGRVDVRWDAPIRHVKVNDLDGWKFGVADAYAAVNWARAYKEFLEDWARLVKSLSRFAWRMTAKGAAARTQAAAKLAVAPTTDPATGGSHAVGGTAITPAGQQLDAIPKSGATIDSESGKPLAAMVAAALGVPVTMLLADPGQTGARATAETLDQPTELEMESRRSLWTGVFRDICEYVVREAVRAPQGPLKGVLGRDEYGRETVTLAGNTEQTIDVAWPDLKDLDPAGVVKAVAEAFATGTVPPEIALRLLLTALGVKNVDELVDEMTDDDGQFLWPNPPPIGGAGQGAADAERAGDDPAAAGPGSMTPGDEPDDEGDDGGGQP